MANRRVLIVAERPTDSRLIEPVWRKLHPSDEIDFFHTPPMGSFIFDIPRDLPLSGVPYIKEVQLKRRNFRGYGRHGQSVFNEDFISLAWRADLIVCATDCDPQGCRNFLDLLEFYKIETPLDQIQRVWPRDFTEASLTAACLSETSILDTPHMEFAAIGRAKQYFDQQWVLNALPVFSTMMKAAGRNPSAYVSKGQAYFSKYALQTLLLLDHQMEGAWTEGEIIRLMQDNPASKKNSPIGSAISQGEIFQGMVSSRILDWGKKNEEGQTTYWISGFGRKIIDLLHKDCFDPHLSARLNEWGTDWPASKPKIDRYIRTFFGKQLRYQTKKMQNA